MAAKKAKAVKKAPAAKAKAAPAKKAPAKKAAAPKAAMPTKGAITEKYGKTQIVTSLAESTGLNRKQVAAVIDGMSDLIGRHLDKKGAGEFVLPGLFKIATIRKPATKARKGINPFTKEEVVFKAKPARTVIKIRPLKKLKEMV
ncbi:HU family DNA-binding protein [Permianibacter aggregans]|uniref:Viral histone-like protein n=1 Tax=Permianibacter aggregans TaxID=1510150 RepID=A0A4R6ULP9_9GAMM|nr:HU family DNA-binding protein [Permianibacter aggregans]QGX39266.1 integration host factor [Permianibacter aggregans]TDQ46075.1 nucleoid DNA-binding protein [Permianibacter aggregans]